MRPITLPLPPVFSDDAGDLSFSPVILPTLIRELEKRGRSQGLSVAEIAKTLGVDRTRFVHIRSGAGRLSLASVHEIACRFMDDTTIRELLLGYLALDVERRNRKSRSRMQLDDGARGVANSLLRNFPSLLVSGGGILLLDPSPARLAKTLDVIEETARGRGVSLLRERAASGLSRERRGGLLAAPIVIIDGVSSLRAPVEEVLVRRAEAARLTFAGWHADLDKKPPPPLDSYKRIRLPPTHRASP